MLLMQNSFTCEDIELWITLYQSRSTDDHEDHRALFTQFCPGTKLSDVCEHPFPRYMVVLYRVLGADKLYFACLDFVAQIVGEASVHSVRTMSCCVEAKIIKCDG